MSSTRPQHIRQTNRQKARNLRLHTFGRAVDDLVLLLSVLEDTLGAEHVTVLHAVELDLLRGVAHAVLDLALVHRRGLLLRVRCRGHGQPSQHLVVHRKLVACYLMRALVVRALDDSVLGEFPDTL